MPKTSFNRRKQNTLLIMPLSHHARRVPLHYKQTPVFHCRCSALGQLNTQARSRSQQLSETAKTMLVTWYKEQLYNRKKEIHSKYLTKGNKCEDASIDYLNQLYGTTYKKNEQFYKNSFIHGTPDIISDEIIIDIKNSWDFTTFPLFSKDLPNKDYMWQLLGYMMLTGRKKGAIIYTLMDLPDEQIEQEYRRTGGKGAVTPEFKANYKYSDLDSRLRVKRFDVYYNAGLVEQIEEKVIAARQFLQSLSY